MMKPQQNDGYTRLQIGLHWATVALLSVQLTLTGPIRLAFRQRLDGAAESPDLPAMLHVALGLTLLALTLLRIGVRLYHGTPAPVPDVPKLLHFLAVVAHRTLYALLLWMPLTGAAAWFLGLELAAILHEAGRLALVALIAAHVFAALVEHFLLRNDTLRRMLGAAE